MKLSWTEPAIKTCAICATTLPLTQIVMLLISLQAISHALNG